MSSSKRFTQKEWDKGFWING